MKYTNDSNRLNKSTQPEEQMLHEALAAYGGSKQQGEYTIEDYYALPDEPRMELIDGVLYAMGAPNLAHQDISFELALRFRHYINENGGDCHVYVSPCDVQLDCDDKTMVQPDVFIVCDRNKLSNGKNIYGNPDLVVEVLSPSSRRKDTQIKTQKYKNAGVREYWIIDPMKRRIVVHDFVSGQSAIYSFTDKIPVGIFDGNLIIDFAEISRELDSVYNIDYSTFNEQEQKL